MNADFVRMQVRGAVWPRCLAIFATVLLGSFTASALPEKGTPAPPLQFTQLLQAPPGAKADWHSLRGKVVVLEFWATWCEGCVAEIPDLNRLVASLDPTKFQFISVDDEDLKIVQTFLAKRKMAGWVGIDTMRRVSAWYGVKSWPTTIIVNGQGRIVAATSPEELTATNLLEVASGKSVKFKPAQNAEAPARTASIEANVKPLYDVSLSKAAPDAKAMMSESSGSMDISGWNAEQLLSYAYDTPESRLILTGSLPKGLYNLHTVWASADNNNSLIAPFLQPAITYGLNLRVQPKTITKKAYVLKATGVGNKLLQPTAVMNQSQMYGYWKGELKLVNGSMNSLAYSLEDGLEVPVVNETGIEGRFDAELEFPAKDMEAAKAALLKTLGLELIEAERPIKMLEVGPREEAKKADEAKPRQTPKP
jgi:uncharacterized protein (TIGR03435 family)